MDAQQTLVLVARLAGLAGLISTFELVYLAGRGEFSAGGYWDWRVIASSTFPRSALVDPLFSRQHSFVLLLIFRGVLCAALLGGAYGSPLGLAIALSVAATQLLTNTRIVWGDDGSDQMLTLVLVVMALSCFLPPEGKLIACYFLAAQSTLSYFCSGCAKLFGPMWRNGSALRSVMGHHAYGNRMLFDLFSRWPHLAAALNFGVIAFQLSFPLFFVVPMPYALGFLAGGAFFHLAISTVMRLNGFLFSFLSAYPALIFVQQHPIDWHHLLEAVLAPF